MFNVRPRTSYVIPYIPCGIQCGLMCSTWDAGSRTKSRHPCGIQRRIMDVVRSPEFNAGCNMGPGTPHWILTSVWPQCGIMDVVRGPESNAGCNAGAGTPYVIPTSVWDPLRDHGRRAGPGITCGMQCGALGPRRYSKRGLSSYVIQNSVRHPQCVIRGLVRNPGPT